MITISNKKIGKGYPVFIVAEMSANHMQNFDTAVQIIKKAKWAGADAIKLQTFTPDTITIDCDNEYFRIKHGLWEGQNLYELYKKAYMPWEWQERLKKIAEEEGLIFLSTPSDKSSVDFLESLNVPAYKIASFEITDIPLIRYVASKGKPIIISTGIACVEDILETKGACYEVGNNQIILLKCSSSYPNKVEEINLKSIPYMEKLFDTPIGLSDHTLSIHIPVASVALGACVIEKHLCLDRTSHSLDFEFSLEPEGFGIMVKAIRTMEKALGDGMYIYTDKMKEGKELCRSLFAVQDIKKGQKFTEDNVRSIRPGYGIPPKYMKDILGKKAKKDIKRGEPLSWKMVDWIYSERKIF